jgi:adenosylcobinamide kinase/adenosylcobinamide-phosphate guanylyltransferase
MIKERQKKMILVTGGSRSGKSEYAENLAMHYPAALCQEKLQNLLSPEYAKILQNRSESQNNAHYAYLATAKITDDEMAERVRRHQARRSAAWQTYEGYTHLEDVLQDIQGKYEGILLDSVSTMITNLLFDFIGDVDWDTFDFADVDYKRAEQVILKQFELLADAAEATDAPLVIVTDEIGLGVIPETPLGRAFRDMMGLVNQALAKRAETVYFVVSGIPVKIK